MPELVDRDLSKQELNDVLSGMTLATQRKSINKDSADYLNNEFDYKHDYNYSSYVDVIDAVRRGNVKFGMIDSVRLETVDYPEIGYIGYNLNPLLKGMYQDMGGFAVENYAIAVHAVSSNSKLLKTLNEIIGSQDWKIMQKKLMKANSIGSMAKPGFDC